MKRTRMDPRRASLSPLAILSLAACAQTTPPIGGQITLALATDSIGVGLDSLVLVEASSSKRDDGEIFLRASAGTFELPGAAPSAVVILRAAEGKVSALLNPPSEVGPVVVTAAGHDDDDRQTLQVVPAPRPVIANLPDSVAKKAVVIIEVRAETPWRNRPIEVGTTHGELFVTGAVEESTPARGDRVKPILDALGTAFVQWTVPDETATVIVSANLFGSTTAKQVTIS